ncbi:MAG: phytoene/squalene synthase family protein [Thermoguttaceae bacterium]|jgi:phytoene synthase
MNPSGDTLQASYAFCRRLSRRSGSNFYLGFLLLPRKKRRAMYALYAFMRHIDDLVDAAPADRAIEPREQLRRWRGMLENSLAGGNGLLADAGRISAKAVPKSEVTAVHLMPALVDTVKKYHIPGDCLFAVLDGVEMDFDQRRYETFEQLRLYCLRVASAVGLACIHIWGFRGQGTPESEAAIEAARQAGIALQLTNILRDLKADADSGRVYLPLEDLLACGYSEEELKYRVVNKAFYRLTAMEIARAEEFYRQGYKLMDFLQYDGQRIFGLMMSTYRSLLEKIARRPSDIFTQQIGLGKFQRLLTAAGWALLPSIMRKTLDEKMQDVKR